MYKEQCERHVMKSEHLACPQLKELTLKCRISLAARKSRIFGQFDFVIKRVIDLRGTTARYRRLHQSRVNIGDS